MIKVYGTHSCPDCQKIEEQISSRNDVEYIDICQNVKTLKEFTRIRDNSRIFDECKAKGSIGIPCFVLEDGAISLNPEDAGFIIQGESYCSLEDHKNGKKGC